MKKSLIRVGLPQRSFIAKLGLCLSVSVCGLVLSGCVTEYYEPKGSNVAKLDGKLYGPVKREGFAPWSNGMGKNLPLSNPSFSVVGK